MSRSQSTRLPFNGRTIAAHKKPGRIWFENPRGLGHRVSPNGARSFVILAVGPNGKQQPRKIAEGDTPLETVKELALAKLATIARGEDPFPEETESPLLSTVMEDHIRYLETKGNQRHGRKLSPRAASSARTDAKRWLKADHLDRLRAKQLTRERLAHWIGRIRTDAGPRAAEKARSMLVAALRLKGIDTSVFQFPDTKARTSKPRRRVLTPDEMRQWQTAVDEAPLRWRVFFSLLTRTGLRPQELATSKRDDYDLKAGTLTIHAARRGKSDSGVTVSLDATCISLLKELWQNYPPFAGYAFPSLKKVGAPVYNYHLAFNAICSAAKLTALQARDLRRTFGTYAALSSLSAEQIAAALGNTSAVTSHTYIQIASDQQVIAQVQGAVALRIDNALKNKS